MRFRRRLFKFILVMGDVALMYLAFLLTLVIRHNNFLFLQGSQAKTIVFYLSFIHIIWLFLLYLLNFYEIPPLRDLFEFLSNLIIFICLALVAGIVYFYILTWSVIAPKTILLIDILIFGIFLFLWRFLFKSMLKILNFKEKIFLIGSTPELREITSDLLYKNGYDWVTYEIGEVINTFYVKEIIKEQRPDLIVLALDFYKERQLVKKIFSVLPLGLNYISFRNFYEDLMKKIPIGSIDEAWLLENLRKRGKIHEFFKRCFDIVFSIVGLIITAVLFPFIVLIIKMDSPGSVFYRQKRVGQDGRFFTFYKFRTMRQDAEANGAQWAVENDSRIIPFGRFLRATHLDEFPQFYNILKGDISFVGPRPERPEFVEELKKKIVFYDIRHLIKPGLTGWAQIKYCYSSSVEEAKEKLKYDLYYIKHHFFAFDLAIILRTVGAILKSHIDKLINKQEKYYPNIEYSENTLGISPLHWQEIKKEALDVLVLDDEKIIQDMLGRFLGDCGYNVFCVSRGENALEIIENNQVRLAVVDIRLPGLMDGFKILKYIKKKNKNIEVILITGFGTERTRLLSNRLGAYAYLEKPFDLAQVKRHIEDALNLSKNGGLL